MAMNSSEAKASVENNKSKDDKTETNHTETQNLSSSFQFSESLTRLMGAYMDDVTLEGFANVVLPFLPSGACQNDVLIRKQEKKVREELLPCVFGSNPDAVEAFLKQGGSAPIMVLTKTSFDEGYFSEKFNKFICFRTWRGVNSLQAAARSGDIFLIPQLLSHIINDDTLRIEACDQLEEVRKKISTQKILMEAIEAIGDTQSEDKTTQENAKLRLDEIQQLKEFQCMMQEFCNEMEELRGQWLAQTTLQKDATSVERKDIAEKIQMKDAEDAEFLAPVLRLMKAYIYYIIQYPTLESQNKIDEIKKNWELIGECHKRLPHYFKQEFFDDKPFHPLPSFATAPKRGPCHYWNGSPLNLDELGFGTFCGLCRGVRGIWGQVARQYLEARLEGGVFDLIAITYLYKLRLTGLEYIIEQLKTPETAKVFIKGANGPSKS